MKLIMCINFIMSIILLMIKCKSFLKQVIMIPIVLSVIARAVVEAQNCFGGVETFEKTTVTDFDGSINIVGTLLHQENVALTRDCINLCKQQSQCQSFGLNYAKFRCSAYSQSSKRNRDRLVHAVSTNFFEKVCLNGLSRQAFDNACGHERLWAFERVKSAFIDGFVEKESPNIGSREECAKTCLMETSFICRSADYDEVRRICRMSKEDRRTQPQAFRQMQGSSRDYLENQCAAPGPSSCVYRTKPDFSVLSMDSLHFATSSDDCQMQCDRESSFNCRAFSYVSNRCVLSGDDGVSLVGTTLPSQKGATYGERTCVAELCTNGIFTYEKITGHVLRTAITTAVELPNIGSLGATGWCRESCDSANLNCPAFSVNYQSTRCEKLDRNSQGRTGDLVPREGESYFEKICLRVPQIMSQCQDKYWAFERVLGYELAPVLYVKTLNFVQSRRDCEEYCLQVREFPCRSALYNDETTECRLSPDDRRTSPGSYYRSRSTKINYLENQCVRSHSTCPYERTLDAYPTYTDLVETNGVSSHEVCEAYCNDNKRFLCRSFAYYSSNGQCFISGDDRSSAGPAAIQKRSGIVYFERLCPRLPTTGSSSSVSQVTSSQITNPTPSVSPSVSPSVPITPSQPQSPTLPTTSSSGVGSSVDPSNGSSTGSVGAPVTKFPASLIPTLPPKGNGFSPQFDPFAQTHPQPPSHVPSVSSPRLEVPRALETDLHNVHSQGLRPQPSKCGPHARYLFEKVTSFEPIGGHLTLLYSDLQNPGIVTECARRCEHSSQCRAFVVDYYHQSCHGLFENSSVGNLDLRLSMGKDYFEGFCVPNHIECNKFWPFDRIIDQASIGVTPQDRIRFISRGECRKRCLEERKYKCLSASYDSTLHECRLYSEDRNSGSLTLLFTKGTDYMENQCAIETFTCRYHPIERDISIVTVTKSVRGTSTFHCEQACDHEKEFNCRSYTYLDNPDGHNAPGGNLCLLSSDNRATSHQGSMQFRPRALYAEKDCVNLNQRSRVPSTPLAQPTQPNLPNFAPTFLPNSNQQPSDDIQHNIPHIPARCGPNQYTFEKTFGYDLRYARRERAPMPPRLGVVIHCQDECIRRGDRCKAFIVEYRQFQSCFFLDESAGENRNQLSKVPDTAYVEKICLREKTCEKMWTFERVIGHTLEESADKDITSVLLRTDCQDLCLAEKTFTCRSATFDYSKRLCKLFSETRRSRPNSFKPTNEFIDYFENQCVTEPSTCQYRDYQESFFPYIDRITNSFSLADCQRQCDAERLFPCRSINFETFTRDCALSSEDTVTLGMGSNTLMPRGNSLYSEKGNCEQVSVQCNQQDMVLTLNFDSPFNGRVYAKGSPSQCFVVGTGQTQLQFAISLGSRCGTRQEGANNFANEVIVQQHAVIMTDSDRTIRVLCSFETSDQTVTLGNQNLGKPSGIDVTALMNARTRLEHPITSIVTNTAPPPAVMMRILDRSGHDAQIVGLGDELVLRIELKDSSSAFAIFARNLYARSSNGESLFLIDNAGCPTDPAIFPALQVDLRDKRSLYSTFKAFRFPSTGVVNFEVQIRFCQERCEPVKCTTGSESFGKRRKRSTDKDSDDDRDSDEYINETESLRQDDSIQPILIPNDEAILAVKKRTKTGSNTRDNNEAKIETSSERLNVSTSNINRSALMEEHNNSSILTEPQYTNPETDHKKSNRPESPILAISPSNRPTPAPYPQEWSNERNRNSNRNQMYPIYGYNPSFQPPLAPPPLSTTHLPTHSYPQSHAYYPRNSWNSYNNGYMHNHYNHNNNAYNPNPIPMNPNMNSSRTSYWQSFPQEVPSSQLHASDSVTPYASVSQMPPMNYMNQNEPISPQPQLSTQRPSRPPLPPSYLEWGDARPSRPPPRPSPRNKIIATTERPQPQEVPLSLAIMVGEEKDSNINENNNINNNNNNWKHNNRMIQTRDRLTEECDDCNTGLAVFYTALIVSLVHIGLIAGAYFYIGKLKALRSKFSTEVFNSEEDITRINHHNNGTQSLNDNVFYGNRELGFNRGSLPGINDRISFDSSLQ